MQPLLEFLGGETRFTHTLAVGALVAARVLPLTVFAPWLALRSAPAMLRLAVTLALTVCFTPLAIESAGLLPMGGWALIALGVREALVGTVFAVVTGLPLYALDWAGRLTDTWRGASLAEVVAPPTGERTSPLGDLYILLGVVLFLVLGGHRLAIAAFADGLAAVPVGSVNVGAGVEAVVTGAARLSANALAFAAAIAAPAAAAIVLVEVALGLVARSAPQIPVFFAGMPLRAAVGLAAALLGLSVLVGRLPHVYRDAIDSAGRLILPFGP